MKRLDIEPRNPFSDHEIFEIEDNLGWKMPAEYRDFAKRFGGPFVGGLVDGSEALPVLQFLSAGLGDGILHLLKMNDTFKQNRSLPIADCELGNMYALDDRGYVQFYNFYEGLLVPELVSNSFDEFVDRIEITEALR